MSNRIDRICLFSEMIAFSKNDDDLIIVENDFLIDIAAQLQISKEDFDYLIAHPVNYITPKTYSQRIIQFYKMVLLTRISLVSSKNELIKYFNFGLRMGLSHQSIERVLYLMSCFPEGIIPEGVLVDIIKVQYN